MKRITLFAFLILIFLPSVLFSQSKPSCVIIYAEGEGFTVVSGEEEYFFDLYEEDVIGLELDKNDMIFTESDTLLEIQVASSNNIIKVSENSSILIEDFEEKGGGSFGLTYGKIRAKVQKLTGSQQFTIDGKSAVCGVRGTDFGYDIVADPLGVEDDLLTRIYCFEGSVEVEKKEAVEIVTEGAVEDITGELPDELEEKVAQKILISAEEMVAISTREPEKELVSEVISEEVTTYWGLHEFKTDPLTIITMKDLDEAYGERYFEKRKSLFWGGMSLILAGTALELTSFFLNEHGPSSANDISFSLAASGGVLIFGGIGGLYGYASYE